MIQSRPYKPSASLCCEQCAFGTGGHEDWCPENVNSWDFPDHLDPRLPRLIGREMLSPETLADIESRTITIRRPERYGGRLITSLC